MNKTTLTYPACRKIPLKGGRRSPMAYNEGCRARSEEHTEVFVSVRRHNPTRAYESDKLDF